MTARLEIKRIENIVRLMDWRMEVLAEVFGIDRPQPGCPLYEANLGYFNDKNNSYECFMAVMDGMEAGCGMALYHDELPSPDNPSGRCAYIMNIYVRREFRRRHIATAIVSRLIAVAREKGCGKIYLETTGMARHLYESLEFTYLENMMIWKPTL